MRSNSERGSILALLLILIVIGAVIGGWSLSTTSQGILRSGHYRGVIAVKYAAEEALQKAVRRLQEIADPTLTDSAFAAGLYVAPEKTMNFLVEPSIQPQTVCYPPPPAPTPVPDNPPACPSAFDPSNDLDTIDACNRICNFMGTLVKGTQVMLVRKDNATDGVTTFAVYLINSVATDKVGRRKIVQGVAVVPYAGSAGAWTLPIGQKVYLASILESTGG